MSGNPRWIQADLGEYIFTNHFVESDVKIVPDQPNISVICWGGGLWHYAVKKLWKHTFVL